MSRRIKDILRDSSFRSEKPDYSDPRFWEERMFSFAKNRSLLTLTEGEFPKGYYDVSKLDEVHPTFLLEKIGNIAFSFCPCTSKNHPLKSFIPKGTKTLPFGESTPKTSYILHEYSFNLADGEEFSVGFDFFGIIPENKIIGNEYKRGRMG